LEKELIYVDTSAFYALIDRSDKFYKKASALWPFLLEDHITLITSNYVVFETIGLLQNRLGFDAARLWCENILDVLEIRWVDNEKNQLAFELWYNLGQKLLNLVDCISFITMRQDRIKKVFCFKKNFQEQGFEVIPQLE